MADGGVRPGGGLSGDSDDEFDPDAPLPPSQFFGRQDDEDSEDVEEEDVDVTLPRFANETNKRLDAQVNAKEKLLQQQTELYEENTERVNIMTEHLKNVEQEYKHTQALVEAKSKDVSTEEHLKQLSVRETGRLKADITRTNTLMNDIQDKLNSAQNEMFAANETLDKFKQRMSWNQEELLQWSLAAKQKEEDREALLRYEKLDSVKAKSLTLAMEKAARQLHGTRQKLAVEVTESQAVQIELDKTADEYKRLHQERREMVAQWNDAVAAMHQRDKAIAATSERISSLKQDIRNKNRVIEEQKRFLQHEQANQKSLNLRMEAVDRTAAKQREQLNKARQELQQFEDEVSAQRSELQKAESELRTQISQNQNLLSAKEDKQEQYDAFRELLDAKRTTLENENNNTEDLETRATQVDKLHAEHVQRLAVLTKELQATKEKMFKQSQELFQLRKKEADLIADISGAQGASRNLKQRVHQLDQRSLKQQEMLYDIEFQVQGLERKVSRASGKRTQEETNRLNGEIEMLQKVLDLQKQENGMLRDQVKRLSEELRAARRTCEKVMEERTNLEGKIATIELENDSAAQEVRSATKNKKALIVEHDVLKLETERLRDTLNERSLQIRKLENRKLQLQLSMREREKEVALHSDVQRAELRAADEARHSLSMDLREREIKVEKLKKKYETIAGRLRSNDEEDHSQAYYIIAAAQERETLQREGDELNSTIRRCEKEIRMLAKTLKHLNASNHQYKNNMNKADESGPEAQLQRDLEEQQRSLSDAIYKKKNYLRDITAQHREREQILRDLKNRRDALQEELQRKDDELQKADAELKAQELQKEEAKREVLAKRADFRQARGVSNDDGPTPEEIYLDIQEEKRKNKVLLSLVQRFVDAHSHLSESVADVFEEVGLKFPLRSRPGTGKSRGSRPGTGGSRKSRTGSRASRSGSRASRDPRAGDTFKGGLAGLAAGVTNFPPIQSPASRTSSRSSTGGLSPFGPYS